MRISQLWLRKQISGCLLVALAAPFSVAAAAPQRAANSSPNGEPSPSVQTQSPSIGKRLNTEASQTETLPDSPGSVQLQTIADNRVSDEQQASPQQPQSARQPQRQSSTEQQNSPQEPVGTAASQSVKATGIAASQPAGAAIAPAKQRRTRSILIKVGALVGAGIAVGTVVGLSSASPSRPR